MWLLGVCNLSETHCHYAHDKTYLPTRGWWTDEVRCAKLKDLSPRLRFAGYTDAPTLASLALQPWHGEKWFLFPYGPKPLERQLSDDPDDEYDGMREFPCMDPAEDSDDDDGENEDEDEDENMFDGSMESDPYEWGFSREDIQEMIIHGVKPWDDDAAVSVVFILSVALRLKNAFQ